MRAGYIWVMGCLLLIGCGRQTPAPAPLAQKESESEQPPTAREEPVQPGLQETAKEEAAATEPAESAIVPIEVEPAKVEKVVPAENAITPAEVAVKQEPTPPARHQVHFLILGDLAPVFVRLQLFSDGKPIDESARALANRIVEYLDKDQSQGIAEKEFAASILSSPMATGQETAAPSFAELDADSDGNLTVEELHAAITSRLPGTRLAQGQALDPRVLELFRYLDVNYDNALTQEEFVHSDESLGRFDLDDDELISIEELGGYLNPVMGQARMRDNETGPIRLLPLAASDRSTRKRLQYYKWTRDCLGFSAEDLSKYDSDGNGELRDEELQTFLDDPLPHLDLVVRFGSRSDNESAVEILSKPELLNAVFAKVQQPSDSAVIIELDSQQLTLRIRDDSQANEVIHRLFRQQFVLADRNKNAYLEPDEYPQGVPGLTSFAEIDRDGDEKIFETELIQFLEVQQEVGQLSSELAVSLFGRSIFDMIDANRDHRLSRREIQTGATMLAGWDTDDDGRLMLAEIPRHYEVVVGRAQSAMLQAVGTPIDRRLARAENEPAGPRWFQAMDTNGDGDVSRREFLGNAEQFDKLDRNGDQMLDAHEAEDFK